MGISHLADDHPPRQYPCCAHTLCWPSVTKILENNPWRESEATLSAFSPNGSWMVPPGCLTYLVRTCYLTLLTYVLHRLTLLHGPQFLEAVGEKNPIGFLQAVTLHIKPVLLPGSFFLSSFPTPYQLRPLRLNALHHKPTAPTWKYHPRHSEQPLSKNILPEMYNTITIPK